jgi:hypothetical protein
MKLLRSITHRGFNVGSAGWFTVLKPNPWFPASRQPGAFRYHIRPSAETGATNQNMPTNPPQILIPATDDRHVIRLALIVLAATMVTAGLLSWICNPR